MPKDILASAETLRAQQATMQLGDLGGAASLPWKTFTFRLFEALKQALEGIKKHKTTLEPT